MRRRILWRRRAEGCKSLRFVSWYQKEPLYTPCAAGEGNGGNRYLKVAIDLDGDLCEFLDATAMAGTTWAQLIDMVA